MKHSLVRERSFPEFFFLFIIIAFGVISTFVTFPLTNGDEGYHLSRSYTIFSRNNPISMETDAVRAIELVTISENLGERNFDVDSFFRTKLPDVEKDKVSFNLQKDDNSTLGIDVGHMPAAIGSLIGRFIYPSYGVILIFSRLANLVFFAICLFFIIRFSSVGKWSLFMLFSVPFIQKLASPSYDVFSYVVVSAFAVNLLTLAKLSDFKKASKKQISYTLLTILLIFFAKNNYIFILPSLLFLPMFTNRIIKLYRKQSRQLRIIFWIILLIILCIGIYYSNRIFGLENFARQFFNSYFNVATMGRRGRTLFNVAPTILPDMFNIFWILSLFFVMMTEKKHSWNLFFILGTIIVFFINWFGIYAGFYLMLNKPMQALDELSGRYLHPFIICFLPFTQLVSYKYNLVSSQKAVKFVSITSTLLIMITYLIVCYYRGYIIQTTPTWGTR
ncbi:glycosyltransferase family protein [Enterococcus pingfangensis]|uniref:DUF2142 domain-containing protein n=1 Tax=Enterococcus pingfangensis TaxID=2559924 RepID=UPI001FEBB481|nr:DUF2142 domain-containing protein [Enterococcus pingfangensis]